MATYNLGSDQSARINYDSAMLGYFSDQIEDFVQYAPIEEIDASTFEAWYDEEQEDTDDPTEARARALHQFAYALLKAKFHASDYGLAVPYAHTYTAYVTTDEERGGYHISYCNGMMAPHETSHAHNLSLVLEHLNSIGGDLAAANAIEGD